MRSIALTKFNELLTVFSLVYPEEGSIAETSVKILIITVSVLQFLNLHLMILFPLRPVLLTHRNP